MKLEEVAIVGRREIPNRRSSPKEMAERSRNKRKEVAGDGTPPEGVKDSGGGGSGEAEGSGIKGNGGEEGGPGEVDQSEDGEGANQVRRESDEGGE